MKTIRPKTTSLNDFAKDFSEVQHKIVDEETRHYNLLTSFKEAREKKGLSQEELAKKADVNRTTLSKIESGLRNATIETLDKLATAMDMKLDVKLRME